MSKDRLTIQEFDAACPECQRHQTVELDFAPKSTWGVMVTCDHCGAQSRLSAFQSELARQTDAKEQRKKNRDKALSDEQHDQHKQENKARRQLQNEQAEMRNARLHTVSVEELAERDRIDQEERKRLRMPQEPQDEHWKRLAHVIFVAVFWAIIAASLVLTVVGGCITAMIVNN